MVTKETNDKKKISGLLEDLSLLENYARELFSFSPMPLCFVSPLGVILEANPAFEEISGYSIYEIIGEPIEDFFDKEKIEELSRETLKKGLVKAKEINLFTKKKKKIPVQSFSGVRRNRRGNITGYFLGLFNLTEIKKIEAALEEAKKVLEIKVAARTKELRELTERQEEIIEERTKEIKEKLEESERFQKLTIGRELKMIELKEEIEKLKEELGKHKSSI